MITSTTLRCNHCGASAVVTREEVSPSETGRRCLLCGREPGSEVMEAQRQYLMAQPAPPDLDDYHRKGGRGIRNFHKFKRDVGPPAGRKSHHKAKERSLSQQTQNLTRETLHPKA